jgi:hypothetical protein
MLPENHTYLPKTTAVGDRCLSYIWAIRRDVEWLIFAILWSILLVLLCFVYWLYRRKKVLTGGPTEMKAAVSGSTWSEYTSTRGAWPAVLLQHVSGTKALRGDPNRQTAGAVRCIKQAGLGAQAKHQRRQSAKTGPWLADTRPFSAQPTNARSRRRFLHGRPRASKQANNLLRSFKINPPY